MRKILYCSEVALGKIFGGGTILTGLGWFILAKSFLLGIFFWVLFDEWRFMPFFCFFTFTLIYVVLAFKEIGKVK